MGRLYQDIQHHRQLLSDAVDEAGGSLQDPAVQAASQALDRLILAWYRQQEAGNTACLPPARAPECRPAMRKAANL